MLLSSCMSVFDSGNDTAIIGNAEILGTVTEDYSIWTMDLQRNIFNELEIKAKNIYGKEVTIQIISTTRTWISLPPLPWMNYSVTARVIRLK